MHSFDTLEARVVLSGDSPTAYDDGLYAAVEDTALSVTFTVTLSGKTERAVTVDYATDDDSATAFHDYNGTGGDQSKKRRKRRPVARALKFAAALHVDSPSSSGGEGVERSVEAVPAAPTSVAAATAAGAR